MSVELSAQRWATWHDPDTTNGLTALATAGFEVVRPEQVLAMPDGELGAVALDCSNLLAEVYQGTYPLSAGRANLLAKGVRDQREHLFLLNDPTQKLAAMAELVELGTPGKDPVGIVELGRAARALEAKASARSFLKDRVRWAIQNLRHADFLVSSTRSAGEGNTILPSGKGVQSVWIGGRAQPDASFPVVVSGGNWRYRLETEVNGERVGGIEPFLHFVLPTDPKKWAAELRKNPIFVPTEADAHMIRTMISEGSYGQAMPDVRVVETKSSNGAAELERLDGPSNFSTAKYAARVATKGNVILDLASVDEELYQGIGQEVKIDASTARGAATIANLRKQGWTLVGWQPSTETYGAIDPLMARVNPTTEHLTSLIMPGHHAGYFEKAGLRETRVILDDVYATMLRSTVDTPRQRVAA